MVDTGFMFRLWYISYSTFCVVLRRSELEVTNVHHDHIISSIDKIPIDYSSLSFGWYSDGNMIRWYAMSECGLLIYQEEVYW